MPAFTMDSNNQVFAGRFRPSVTTYIGTVAATMSAGDIFEITNFTGLNDGPTPRPNEGGSNDPMHDWCLGGVYDPKRHRAYVAGAPNGKMSDGGAASTLLIYDAIDNHWFAVRNPVGASLTHCYDRTAYHDDKIYMRRFTNAGGISVLDADTFDLLPEIPMPPTNIAGGSVGWNTIIAMCVVPDIGEAGTLFIVNVFRCCAYDLATQTWSLIAGSLNIDVSGSTLHYNKTSGKLIVGSLVGAPIYIIDPITKTQLLSGNVPCNIFNPGTSSFVESPNSVNSILYGTDNNIHMLNTVTGAWTTEPMPEIFTIENGQSVPQFSLLALMVTIHEYDVILIERYKANGNSRMFLHKLEH